ncbi:MAG: biotin transporter BioY, partial [Anaerolineaceae bacterium]
IAQLAIATLGMIISLFICYLIGTLWFSYVSGSTIAYALTVCVFPFIAFDLLKIVLAITFGSLLRRVMRTIRE